MKLKEGESMGRTFGELLIEKYVEVINTFQNQIIGLDTSCKWKDIEIGELQDKNAALNESWASLKEQLETREFELKTSRALVEKLKGDLAAYNIQGVYAHVMKDLNCLDYPISSPAAMARFIESAPAKISPAETGEPTRSGKIIVEDGILKKIIIENPVPHVIREDSGPSIAIAEEDNTITVINTEAVNDQVPQDTPQTASLQDVQDGKTR